MASTIQLKTGTGSAVPSSLTQGELAINIDNGLIYYGSGSGNTKKQLESFTHITASGNISASGAMYMSQSAGTDNSVVVLSSGKLVTDEINAAVWGSTILTTTETEGTLTVNSTVAANDWTVGLSTTAANAKTIKSATNAEYFPVLVDSANASATAEALKTPSSGFTFNPSTRGMTINNITASIVSASGDLYANKIIVNDNYSYQYISFIGQSTVQADGNWEYLPKAGIGNHTWNVNGGASGVTVNSSTITVDKTTQHNGLGMPHACTLIGFSGMGSNASGNRAYAGGLFVGTPAWNTTTSITPTLRAYATPTGALGSRAAQAIDLTRSHSLAPGDVIYPAIRGDGSNADNVFFNFTVVLKVPIL